MGTIDLQLAVMEMHWRLGDSAALSVQRSALSDDHYHDRLPCLTAPRALPHLQAPSYDTGPAFNPYQKFKPLTYYHYH